MKNPSVESVVDDHTQVYTDGFPIICHVGPFAFWVYKLCGGCYQSISNLELNVCFRMACGGLGVA